MDFRILGPIEVVADGESLPLGGLKQRALLAALVLQPDQVVSTDALVETLWDREPPTSAVGIVRTYASRLRSLLWPAGESRLRSKPPGYVLELEPAQVDANRFEHLVREAKLDLDGGRPAAASSALASAHRLWRGDALADLADLPSLRPAIARLDQMRLAATELRVEAELTLGRHADVVAELTELTAQHPTRERFWSQLITALYRNGRQAEALAAYQSMRSTLVEQLGIDPSPELQALEQQVLSHADNIAWKEPTSSTSSVPGRASPMPDDGPDHRARVADGRDLVDWPIQIGRPPAMARAFQTREALVAEIGVVGGDHGPPARDVVIVGGGGVGKTQLAVAAFAAARTDGVDLLVWANASSRESVVTAYAHAKDVVERRTVPGRSASQAAGDFLSWLATTPRRWLVVLDDVTTAADVQGLWPDGRSGRVLATTRLRDLAPADAKQVPVGVFTPSEALRYLRERLAGLPALSPHPEVLDEAAELADDVGRLPVALAQAAAVILNDGITCATYRRTFSNRSNDLDGLFPKDVLADEYANSVSTTWSLALERADEVAPAGLARHVMRIAAVLDPNGVPNELWNAPAALTFLAEQMRGRGQDRVDPTGHQVQTVLRTLHRLSLVTHEPAGGEHAVRTHTLVQRATLEPLPSEQRSEIARVAADALTEIWPSPVGDTELTRSLLQNVTALAARDEAAVWTPEVHEVLFRAGETLGKLGRTDDAIGYWTAMASTAYRRLGRHHPDTLAIRWYLADGLGDAGDVASAAAAFEELVSDCRRVLGDDHPNTLTARHSLASWRGATGDIVGARRGLQSLAEDRTLVLGAHHPTTFATLSHQADWQGASGDVAEAVAALEELVDDARRVFGPEHPETLARRAHLADWRGATGDAAGAAEMFGELVDVCLRAFGPDHAQTLAVRHGLATMRGVAGDPGAAIVALEELVDDRSRALGPDHRETLATRYSLAFWRGAGGDLTGAARALDEVARDRSQVLGVAHPDTLTTRHAQVWCQGFSGDASGAVTELEHLVEDSCTLLGASHRHTLATRNHLAFWRGSSGDVAGAVTELEHLVEDSCTLLGASHRHTLTTRNHLAHWMGVLGWGTAAVEALTTLVQDYTTVFGPIHPDTLAARRELAGWDGVTGDAARVVDTFKALVDDYVTAFGPDHPDTLATYAERLRWEQAAGEGEAALRDLRETQSKKALVGNPHTFAKRIGLGDWRLGRRWETSWDRSAGGAGRQEIER